MLNAAKTLGALALLMTLMACGQSYTEARPDVQQPSSR